ncbi:MAG TPA: MHYT domain-containing protein [Trebonia sp.]|jgi:NO-binding membrane sensor protein with MHYT domain|nr:MHYT domain-containing protein [Trebonia sp.]
MTVAVHNFSYGLVNPVLGYAMSCLGAFLGLRCVTRARAYTGAARARWVILAAVALGAGSIWAMHFIAMLGFTIPGQTILYNVPVTIVSMLIAIVVVGIGLFIVTNGNGRLRPLLIAGVIVGIGVASMHYLGMEAMSMPDSMHYNAPLFVVSVLIAVVAGTAGLWAGTRVRSIGATVVASLIFGVAVSGMHYTGMAAMRVTADGAMSGGSMASMGGASAISFIVPLLAGISLLMFGLTLAITLSPSEAEIHEDAVLQYRMDTEFAPGLRVNASGADFPVPHDQGQIPGLGQAARQPGAGNAFTPGGYANGNGNGHANGYPNGNGHANGYANRNGYANGNGRDGNDRPGPSPSPLPIRRPRREGGGGPGSA